MAGLVAAYRAIGFEVCDSGEPVLGVEKVALYATADGFWTHAARQLPSGKWTSKLGRWVDIEHDTPDDMAGGIYGEVFGFTRRPLSSV